MNELGLFAGVALAHLLALMSPGPDFAMVVRQTLAHGRHAGVWTALGIGAGISVHVGWGLFGLGWIIERVPLLLEALRLAGAGFLIWMGVQALRAQPQPPGAAQTAAAQAGTLRHFGIGLATNLLNPKVMLFFVALFSAIVTAQTSWALRAAIGSWIVATTVGWFCLVSGTLGLPAIRTRLQASAHWIDRGMGAVLLLIGIGMLIAAQRA